MNSLLQWNAAVKTLLGWRRADDEEKWAEKAVEALVKKLKKRKEGCGTLEDLEFALAHPGAASRCVTIPKSLDGRLQVNHRKSLPHIIYCQVWRWPDLKSHQELRAIPQCAYPYESNSKSSHICINPYHYNRIEHPKPWSYGSSSFSSPQSISSPMSFSTSSPPNATSGSASSAGSDYGAASPSVFSEDGDTQPRQLPSPISKLMPAPHYWGSISYYELNTRVGEVFKFSNPTVTVDGFTNPSNSEDRVCLGLLSNVNRNTTVENTRRHIGRGIVLQYSSSNSLMIRNLSGSPIFVQSWNCNILNNQQHLAVIRVPQNAVICAFDNSIFYESLQDTRMSGSIEKLYSLQTMCSIRLSFAKGWGPDYPRQDVTSTPCWLEIRLHVPLTWIDQTLSSVGPPSHDATSVS
ncbi:unnamed protein product [Auanema sp. JU1783]|nr:unnamed protein product [Auanema sp. JU1783]